jgi:hypothetical protein
MHQRAPWYHASTVLFTGLVIACLSGCLNDTAGGQPYKEPTWASSVVETAPKHPDRPTGLRCTVLPQSALDVRGLIPSTQSSSRIAELRRTKGRDIPVVALASLPHLKDGSVNNGYTILPSAGSPDQPMSIGLTLGAKNFRKSGRFIEFNLDVEYATADREVPFKDAEGSIIRIPLRSAYEVHTAVALAPDQAMVFGIPGKEFLLLIEFTFE